MPRRKLELPDFLEVLPENLRPTRPEVNRLVFPSPLAEWPGTVTTPCYLSAAEYHEFWSMYGKGQPEGDDRHWAYFDWETRFHLAKAWNLKGLDNDQLQQDPINTPDLRIVLWFLQITQAIINEATQVPNSQRPSNATKTTLKKRTPANEKKMT